MTSMLLVRHGQSEWNALGRWQGQADPPLSELGRAQAASAGSLVGAVDVIVASDLERAADTAAIIAEQIGVGPVVTLTELRERHAGEWQGLTRDEIERDWPGYLATDRRPPGWEPDHLVVERVGVALDALHERFTGASALVITHAGAIYALEQAHGLGFERIANLGGREVHHHGERVTLGERTLLVDEAQAPISVPKAL